MAATNRMIMNILDYYGKLGRTRVSTLALTAGNFAAQSTLKTAFVTAAVALSIGTETEDYVDADIVSHTPTPPTSQNATRASKWLVRFVDQINGVKGTFTISSPDLTLLSTNQPFLGLGSGAGAAFKTAAEAYVLSEDGNAITVVSVEYVPRKN